MECLTSNYWKDFIDSNGKFNGQKFEKLVKSLLPSLGLQLNQTKVSWDGARDFQDKYKKIWAECKMHRENVSIRLLSPTLLMAVLDKPKKIYFFSYSRLNNNSINYLSQFQDSTNIPISVFDDSVLESLLLDDPITFNKYFPQVTFDKKNISALPSIRIGFSKDPEIEYSEESIENPKNKQLYIYSIFALDIFLRNLNAKSELICKLNLDDIEKSKSFFLLNKEVRRNNFELQIRVEPGSVYFHRLYLKAIKAGKHNLPSFIFCLQKNRKRIGLKPKQIHISAIIKTPLVGNNYHDLLKKFKANIQARHQPIFYNIYGESGTGKSRMVREFKEALFEEEFYVIKFDGEDLEESKFKDFIQKLFSKIFKLPIVADDDAIHYPRRDFIYDVLYSPGFRYEKNIAKCVEYFLKGIRGQKYAFLIDNLQNYDEATLTFIDNLVTRSQNTNSRFFLVCCFNTNLLYGETKSYEVFQRFKIKSEQSDDTFFSEEIKGFKENDFEVFLDHCLQSISRRKEIKFTEQYPETTSLLKEKVIKRPLFIEQTLLYLEQEGAIARVFEHFYVRDIGKFHQILNVDFPDSLFGLISLRWEIFKKNLGRLNINDLNLIDAAIKFFTCFHVIKYQEAISYGISQKSISALEQGGFIVIDERENINFYHHQLFVFFKTKIKYAHPGDHLSYYIFLEKNELANRYFFQYFILSCKLNRINNDLLLNAINRILTGLYFNDLIVDFSNYLFDAIITNHERYNISHSLKLVAFLKIGKIIQVFKSMEDRQMLLLKAYNYIQEDKSKFVKSGVSYFEFLHGLANACITVHKDEYVIPVLNKLLTDKSISFIKSKDRFVYLGKIYNRLCVLYKSVGLTEHAFTTGLYSKNLALKCGDKKLLIRNYLDIANVYGRKIEFTNTTLDLWRKAIAVYSTNKAKMQDLRAMVQLYEAQFYILKNDYRKGIALLKDGVRLTEVHSTYFFGVKYLLLQIVAALTFNKVTKTQDLFELLYKAKDWAVRFQINRTYWKILFIEGRLILIDSPKNVDQAAQCFIQMLQQFTEKIKSSAIEEYNYTSFEYLSYFFALMNLDPKLRDSFYNNVNYLQSMKIRNLFRDTRFDSKTVLKKSYNQHTPQLIYNDGKFDFPVIG